MVIVVIALWYSSGSSGDGCHGVVVWWYIGGGSGDGCHDVVA